MEMADEREFSVVAVTFITSGQRIVSFSVVDPLHIGAAEYFLHCNLCTRQTALK